MKITNVDATVLDTGKNYTDPAQAAEAHGVRFVSLIRIDRANIHNHPANN